MHVAEEHYAGQWLSEDGKLMPYRSGHQLDILSQSALFSVGERYISRIVIGQPSSSRYVLVTWPVHDDLARTFDFIGENAALDWFRENGAFADHVAALSAFIKIADESKFVNRASCVSVAFRRSLADLIVDSKSFELAATFVERFLRAEKYSDEAKAMLEIAATFVEAFGAPLVRCIIDWALDSGVAAELYDHLGNAGLRGLFLGAVVTYVKSLSLEQRSTLSSMTVVWELAITACDFQAFDGIVAAFEGLEARMLEQAVDAILLHAKTMSPERYERLQMLLSRRVRWLRCEIARLDKPFSWEMPDATFPDDPDVEEFLRGPSRTKVIVGEWKGDNEVFDGKASYVVRGERNVMLVKTKKLHISNVAAIEVLKAKLDKIIIAGASESSD